MPALSNARRLPRKALVGVDWRKSGAFSKFDWLMLSVVMLAISTSLYWKDTNGPLILALLGAVFVFYVTQTAIHEKILLGNGLLFAWSLLGLVYLGLSWARWTVGTPVVFHQAAILRMGYFVILIYPATAAFYVIISKARASGQLPLIAMICTGLGVASAFAYHFYPVYDEVWRFSGQNSGFISDAKEFLDYGPNNVAVLFWWGLFFLALRSRWMMLLPLGILFASDAVQMRILAIVATIVWLAPKPRTLARPLGLIVVFGFPIVGLILAAIIKDVSVAPDTIGRARWWADSLLALLRNYGFGYGFGADSVVDYTALDRLMMMGKWAKLPVMVIHNSFIYVFYAMGVVGGTLFLLFHFRDLSPSSLRSPDFSRHATIIFLMICIATSVNTALESPNYVLGLCWTYAYLLNLNGTNSQFRNASQRIS